VKDKIAISLPHKTFVALEKKRRELKKTRSAIVSEAIDAWLTGSTLSEEERRYIAGYLSRPETEQDVAAFSAASAWGEWDEA
jgi:metal-responsive CopG/Arc/MetJ family transcriptional regulator